MKTLWSGSHATSRQVLEFTIGDDRVVDQRLLRWDIIGSLGHIEGLAASRLLSKADHRRLQGALRGAVRAVDLGRLRIGRDVEDGHSAVEAWLTRLLGPAGGRIHTGRSRNDQVATDIRLWLKAEILTTHAHATGLIAELLAFAARERTTLWPGYTHTRRAMPSSAGVWSAAFAEGLLDTLESVDGLWRQVDRSPLGSAAGYGVPLPIRREVAARALGFAEPEHAVGAVQNGRGKLEAAALFWLVQLGHDVAKLAADVVLFSGEEFGLLELPRAFATGSSIMPHKKNPDVFELIRGRQALVEAALAAVLGVRSKLTSGYHRDFQLLKGPLLDGFRHGEAVLGLLPSLIRGLRVDRGRSGAMLTGGILATDEVMRRAEAGMPFRQAYRQVAEALGRGDAVIEVPKRALLARRSSLGGVGNLDLRHPAGRLRGAIRWRAQQQRRFDAAIGRLIGRGGRR